MALQDASKQLFSNAEPTEDPVQYILDTDDTYQLLQGCGRPSHVVCDEHGLSFVLE